LVLVLLSQILRPYGKAINATLSPATDMTNMVRALSELLAVKPEPSSGHVIEFDLNTVTVDLGPFPIDEVLDFRAQNLEAHRRYSLSVRKFAMEVSCMPEEEQKVAFDLRQAELDELASDLRKRARKAWQKPSSFALSLVGAALSVVSPAVAGVLTIGAAATGYQTPGEIDAGAYSYLFNARNRFSH
jgi:predicted anti-sigma-YlaC factor YlaD